jgi:hypothetical protein
VPNRVRGVAVLLCLWAGTPCSAWAASGPTIAFENLPVGSSVTDQYRALGVIFGGPMRVWGPPATVRCPVSGLHSVVITDPTSPTSDCTIRADFVVPGTTRPAVTAEVGFTPTNAAYWDTLFTLRAYDHAGTLLAQSVRNVDAQGWYNPANDTEVVVRAPNIAYVTMTVRSSAGTRSVEGDNFRFVDPVERAVPGPGAGLIVAGMLGAAARRRARPR